MVVVEACGDLTLLCAEGSLLLYDHSTSEAKVINVLSEWNNSENKSDAVDGGDGMKNGTTKPTETEKGKEESCVDGNGEDSGNGSVDGKHDGAEVDEGGRVEKSDKSESNNASNREEDGQGIVAANFSADGQWMVLACGWKAVEVWSTVDCQRKVTYSLVKKPTSLVVVEDCGIILVADKAGDVYQFSLPSTSSSSSSSSSKEELKPILGHLSMLLDVTTTPDNRFILTCDRDEKIRVSHLSRPYEIHTYLLGHREFVTQLVTLSSQPPCVVSSSGDGTMKLWDYDSGKCLSDLDLSSFASPFLLPPEPAEESEGRDKGEKDCSTPPHPSSSPSIPPVPAVKGFAVTSLSSSSHLVAAFVDRARAVVLCKVEENSTLLHLSTTRLAEEPLTATWRKGSGGGGGEELVVVVEGGGVVVMERKGEEMRIVEEVEDTSGLVHLGKLHSHWLRGSSSSSSRLAHLYKQKYDNVSQYLEKKKERQKVEEAFLEGRGPPPPKKGRWMK